MNEIGEVEKKTSHLSLRTLTKLIGFPCENFLPHTSRLLYLVIGNVNNWLPKENYFGNQKLFSEKARKMNVGESNRLESHECLERSLNSGRPNNCFSTSASCLEKKKTISLDVIHNVQLDELSYEAGQKHLRN